MSALSVLSVVHPAARCLALLGWLVVLPAGAQSGSNAATPGTMPPGTASPAPAGPPTATRLFAVEIQTGPHWDPALPPQSQSRFKEHSAHLKQLRDAGRIRAGARYADKGLLVLEAPSEAEARSWMEADPSIQSGTFRFTLSEMRVFYPGTLGDPSRR